MGRFVGQPRVVEVFVLLFLRTNLLRVVAAFAFGLGLGLVFCFGSVSFDSPGWARILCPQP